jgi:hypothetical protein
MVGSNWEVNRAETPGSLKSRTVEMFEVLFRPKFGLKNTSYDPNVVIDRNVKNSSRTVSNRTADRITAAPSPLR